VWILTSNFQVGKGVSAVLDRPAVGRTLKSAAAMRESRRPYPVEINARELLEAPEGITRQSPERWNNVWFP